MTLFQALGAIALITCCLVTLVLYVRQEQRRFDASLETAEQARLALTTDTPSDRPVTVEFEVLPAPRELTAR